MASNGLLLNCTVTSINWTQIKHGNSCPMFNIPCPVAESGLEPKPFDHEASKLFWAEVSTVPQWLLRWHTNGGFPQNWRKYFGGGTILPTCVCRVNIQFANFQENRDSRLWVAVELAQTSYLNHCQLMQSDQTFWLMLEARFMNNYPLLLRLWKSRQCWALYPFP